MTTPRAFVNKLAAVTCTLVRVTLIALIAICGCATQQPFMYGGRTTPLRRVELGGGASTRIHLSSFPSRTEGTPTQMLAGAAAQSGPAPWGSFRYGLSRETDLGVVMSPWLSRFDFRYAHVLSPGSERWSLITSLSPHVGALHSVDGSAFDMQGARYGLTVPFFVAFDASDLYEFWSGPWVRGELARGDVRDEMSTTPTSQSLSANNWSAGWVLGVGLGFRHIHALFEMNASYEAWNGDLGNQAFSFHGFVLAPAIALRLRY